MLLNEFGFSRYKTDNQEHFQKGMVVDGELMVVGAYSVKHPDGITQVSFLILPINFRILFDLF